MDYYRLKEAPIQEKIVQLFRIPESYEAISFSDGLKGQVNTLFIEALTDYVCVPFPIVSDEMFKLIRAHQPDVQARFVSLNREKNNEEFVYWALKPKSVKCLHPREVQQKVSSLVLDENKLIHERFFTIEELDSDTWILNLDVLESLLRRGLNGFEWEKVKVAP